MLIKASEVTRTGLTMLEYRYDSPFKFTGTIDKLTYTVVPDLFRSEWQETTDKTVAQVPD